MRLLEVRRFVGVGLTVFGLGFASTFAAAADSPARVPPVTDATLYSHRFASYPNLQNDCDATAKALFEHFTEVTGGQVGHSVVKETDQGATCSIAFDYTSETPLKVESTYRGDFMSSLDSSGGMYGSVADCQADLPAQKEVFERSTGLEAVVSYCYHVENLETAGSDREFVLRIDGFGKAAAHLWDFDEILEPGIGLGDIESRVTSGLSDQGINVSRVTLKRGLGGVISELMILYYAPKRLPIDFWAITAGTDELCQSLLTVAPGWFAAAGEPALIAYCKPSIGGAAYPQLFVLRVEKKSSGIVDAPKNYRTYEQCMEAQTEVFAGYEEREHWQPFGAMCGITWDGYQMSVFGPMRE